MSTSLILPSPIQSLKCRVGCIEISQCNLLGLVYLCFFLYMGRSCVWFPETWAVLQAMVHELLGIQDNRVDLTKLPKVPKDLQVFAIFTTLLSHVLEVASNFGTRSGLMCEFLCCRKLCYHRSKMHSSKQTCTRTLETWVPTLRSLWMSFN